MALYMDKFIWVATDYDIVEPIAASPCFEDLINLLYTDHYLDPQETKIKIYNEWKTLEKALGPDWLHTLKKFSAARLNIILDWNINLKQIEFYETTKDVLYNPMKLTKENFEKYIKNPEVKKYHPPRYIFPSNLIKKEIIKSCGGLIRVIK